MLQTNKINYSIIILFLLIMYAINIYAFKNGFPTCENYVMNTYLYLALSICYIYFNINKFQSYNHHVFIPFLISIAAIIYINLSNHKTQSGIAINHIVWFVFLTALSFMIIPITSMSSDSMIHMALYFTFSIFIIMSALVYMYPSFFKKTMNFMLPGLLVALIMIILVELYLIFIKQQYPANIHRYIGYVVVTVFSLFISYDTQLMFEEAEQCRKYANYPESSMKFILDVVNIFVRSLALQKQ
jgi:FtsH-binding integral membrane protein